MGGVITSYSIHYTKLYDLLTYQHGFVQLRQQLLQDRMNVIHLFEVTQQEGKLIAGQARHQIGFPYLLLQPAGQGLEQLIAGLMPQAVIDVSYNFV